MTLSMLDSGRPTVSVTPLTVQSNLLVASAEAAAASGRNGRVGDRRPSTVDLWAVQSGLETFASGCNSALEIGEA